MGDKANRVQLSEKEIEIIREMCKTRYLAYSIAAKNLYMHHNSVLYHVNKITKQTGHDPRTFDGMLELVKMVEGSREKSKNKSRAHALNAAARL